ncbi:hypothetical protein [Bacillus altitudinis]|uniref:hypothetical protein n=1 Tax=Bacillus altitudinis TaxID=293387 RepID=UPI0020D1B06A|nr:hypothetical protein [Bacillus altitudinis]
MKVLKNVELDEHKLLIYLNVDRSGNGWIISERLARDVVTNAVVYRQARGSIVHFVDKTLKEIIIETAQVTVERITAKEKDNEEFQELKKWDGIIKS